MNSLTPKPRRLVLAGAAAALLVATSGSTAHAAVAGNGSATGQAARCAAAASSEVIGSVAPCALDLCATETYDPSCLPD